MRSMFSMISVSVLFAVACTGGSTRQITAFNTLDPCVDHGEEACLADGERCQWFDLGAPCIEGEPCRSGVCQQIDPCRAHTDEGACAADTDSRCAWAATELCPAEDCGAGGYCYQVTDEQPCSCACPACEPGEACPPCECACADDTCTCSGTSCPDGDPTCVPEPFECVCEGGGGSGGDCGGGSIPPEPQ